MAHVMVERHPTSVELKLWIDDEGLVVSYVVCGTRFEHGNRLHKRDAAKQMVAACMNGAGAAFRAKWMQDWQAPRVHEYFDRLATECQNMRRGALTYDIDLTTAVRAMGFEGRNLEVRVTWLLNQAGEHAKLQTVIQTLDAGTTTSVSREHDGNPALSTTTPPTKPW